MQPCRFPGCRALTAHGYCPAHGRRNRDDRRPSSRERGYTHRWEQASKNFLARAENALCRVCLAAGRVEPATCVDHVVPHRGNMGLFWTESNWQPLCKACHDRKTGRGE
jgi:5-methylcytosine-specific restriction protein A